MSQVKLLEVGGIEIFPDGRMKTESAARYLGCSSGKLALMRCYGGGPNFIKRGRIFYFKEDLDAWLSEGGKSSSTTEAILRKPKAA